MNDHPGGQSPAPGSKGELPTPVDEADAEAREFYRRLEQTGRLAEVEPESDLSNLPPHITHVRYPDGRVERVGFSGS